MFVLGFPGLTGFVCSRFSRLCWICLFEIFQVVLDLSVQDFPGCTGDVLFWVFQVVLVMFCSGVSRLYWRCFVLGFPGCTGFVRSGLSRLHWRCFVLGFPGFSGYVLFWKCFVHVLFWLSWHPLCNHSVCSALLFLCFLF